MHRAATHTWGRARQHHDRRHLLCAVVALAASTSTTSSSAAPVATTPARIRYEAPTDCPSAAEFLDAVKHVAPNVRDAVATNVRDAVATNVRNAKEGESVTTLDVTIESAAAGGFRGRLTVPGAGVRIVDADSCLEATGLLAFAAALAIEGGGGSRPNESAILASASNPEATAEPSAPALGSPLRQSVSTTAALVAAANPHGSGGAVGVAALYRRELLVVGAVADLGVLPSTSFWSLCAAGGVSTNLLSWLRVDVLGAAGVDAYARASPPDESGSSNANALLPLVGARLRATVEVANVAIGLAAAAETDLGSATRSYTLYPSSVGPSTNQQARFSLGGPRATAGIVLGTTFDL
jgi:hypothetical protein